MSTCAGDVVVRVEQHLKQRVTPERRDLEQLVAEARRLRRAVAREREENLAAENRADRLAQALREIRRQGREMRAFCDRLASLEIPV